MMMELSYLRNMQESDLDWVLQIEQQAYDFPWSLQGFENSLDQGLNYIFCNADGEGLGYACVLTVLDEAHLLNLCVAPKFQGRGLGKQALQTLQSKLKESDFNIMFLEVRGSNEAALKLYERCGFNRDGVRANYYRCHEWDEEKGALVETKEDAILMSCPL
ncbi:ribosomal protein S18-alanine N-acetyltransferase [Thiomicrorhabdus cannonii]|uniref:ribosomal protein S18-alanine N-acetyltransferase n=1 Tax=Thiomicrorhabdus cannonii TaxID=2748011 RepID=UPI001C4C5C3B|nr:ribosomal protein S18-alanine N-acetyltransferase [Thiomicrorhabdus cannonii]